MTLELTIEPVEMEFEMVDGLEVVSMTDIDINVIGSNSHYDHIETSTEEIRFGRYIRQSIAAEKRMIDTINAGLSKANTARLVNRIVVIAKREGVWKQCREAVMAANARINKVEKMYRNGVIMRRGRATMLVSSSTNRNPRAYASRMAKQGWEIERSL